MMSYLLSLVSFIEMILLVILHRCVFSKFSNIFKTKDNLNTMTQLFVHVYNLFAQTFKKNKFSINVLN